MSEQYDGNTGWRVNDHGDVVPPDVEVRPMPIARAEAELHLDHPYSDDISSDANSSVGPDAARTALEEAQQRAADRKAAEEAAKQAHLKDVAKRYQNGDIQPSFSNN